MLRVTARGRAAKRAWPCAGAAPCAGHVPSPPALLFPNQCRMPPLSGQRHGEVYRHTNPMGNVKRVRWQQRYGRKVVTLRGLGVRTIAVPVTRRRHKEPLCPEDKISVYYRGADMLKDPRSTPAQKLPCFRLFVYVN